MKCIAMMLRRWKGTSAGDLRARLGRDKEESAFERDAEVPEEVLVVVESVVARNL